MALRGQSILSKTISIKQLLHEQQLREVAYGPLPDAGHLDRDHNALSPVACVSSRQKGTGQTTGSPTLAIPPLGRKSGDGLGPAQCEPSVEEARSFFFFGSTFPGPSACSNASPQDSTIMPPSRKKAKDKLRSAQRKRWKRQALRAAGVTYQKEKLLKNALYGPLGPLTDSESDSELTDADNKGCHDNPPCHQPPAMVGWRANDRVRTAERRRRKRLALQAGSTTSSKGITKKRRAAAARDVITVDYCLSTAARVSQPGWIGRRVSGLRCREFSLQELVDDYGMTCFPWDGR